MSPFDVVFMTRKRERILKESMTCDHIPPIADILLPAEDFTPTRVRLPELPLLREDIMDFSSSSIPFSSRSIQEVNSRGANVVSVSRTLTDVRSNLMHFSL